jgi:hypothetical protein
MGSLERKDARMEACLRHGKEGKWLCAYCKKAICPLCNPMRIQGQIYCTDCGKIVVPTKQESFPPKGDDPFRIKFILTVNAIFLFIFILCYFFLNIDILRIIPLPYLVFIVLSIDLISFLIFFRCPQCHGFLGYYFSNDFFEFCKFLQFKRCPDCGFESRK